MKKSLESKNKLDNFGQCSVPNREGQMYFYFCLLPFSEADHKSIKNCFPTKFKGFKLLTEDSRYL